MSNSGVYPCYENQFQIDTAGGSGNAAALKPIAGMESFSVAIDGNVEEWKPFEAAGWTRRLVTGKSLTISITGKRNIGDEGNDYVNSLALKTGSGASTTLVWTFPDGAKLTVKGVVSVTEWSSGDSTVVAPLSFDFMSDGKPEFTDAPSA
nr:MAG TPA: major tail protein [Caudoviricetes sp.]